MRALWVLFETLDLATIRTLERVDRWLGRPPLRERVASATEGTPEPTAAPKFEK